MATGCPIVLKIPSQTPLALLKLAALIERSGAVPGSVTMAPMSIPVGDRLVTDDRFKVLSFTGSRRLVCIGASRLSAPSPKSHTVFTETPNCCFT